MEITFVKIGSLFKNYSNETGYVLKSSIVKSNRSLKSDTIKI